MTRKNFPKSVKVACIKRATRVGIGETAGRVIYCEECGLPTRKFEIDHINADGLTGKPTLENAKLLCEPCHADKTKGDVASIASAKRKEAAHLGARTRPVAAIKSAPFPISERVARRQAKPPVQGVPAIARRFQSA